MRRGKGVDGSAVPELGEEPDLWMDGPDGGRVEREAPDASEEGFVVAGSAEAAPLW